MFKREKEIVTTSVEVETRNIYCDICGAKISKSMKVTQVYFGTAEEDSAARIHHRMYY